MSFISFAASSLSNMTTQMIIRIDDKVKNRLTKLARIEGKMTSEMVRELIEGYIKERDIGTYIRCNACNDKQGCKSVSQETGRTFRKANGKPLFHQESHRIL